MSTPKIQETMAGTWTHIAEEGSGSGHCWHNLFAMCRSCYCNAICHQAQNIFSKSSILWETRISMTKPHNIRRASAIWDTFANASLSRQLHFSKINPGASFNCATSTLTLSNRASLCVATLAARTTYDKLQSSSTGRGNGSARVGVDIGACYMERPRSETGNIKR